MKKVTVILSGVGIYGYSSLALMEFFDNHHIKPSLIVGCSEGALIAALWAKGYAPAEALEVITRAYNAAQKIKMDILTALFFFKKPFGKHSKENALFKVKEIQEIYKNVFKEQLIENLPVQTIFQTTNVDLGETYFIREGLLADAVYAASAILPFYPPIKINNQWLADGVFSEFLPLRTMLSEKSDVIIAIDPQIPAKKDPKNFMDGYARFLQKVLKASSAPRTALVYDLHNDEILIIPIKISEDADHLKSDNLEHLLDNARKSIAAKESLILDTIG